MNVQTISDDPFKRFGDLATRAAAVASVLLLVLTTGGLLILGLSWLQLDDLNAPITSISVDHLKIAVFFGCLGGILYELATKKGAVQFPDFAGNGVAKELSLLSGKILNLGLIGSLLIGSAAALIILDIAPVSTLLHLIVTSLIAGSAGPSVLNSMQNRLLAMVAEAQLTAKEAKIDHIGEYTRHIEGLLVSNRSGTAPQDFADQVEAWTLKVHQVIENDQASR